MWEDIKEVIKFFSCFFGTLAIIISVAFLLGYKWEEEICKQKGEAYEVKTEYKTSGCYAVIPEGKMLIRHYEEQTQRTLNVNMVK